MTFEEILADIEKQKEAIEQHKARRVIYFINPAEKHIFEGLTDLEENRDYFVHKIISPGTVVVHDKSQPIPELKEEQTDILLNREQRRALLKERKRKKKPKHSKFTKKLERTENFIQTERKKENE